MVGNDDDNSNDEEFIVARYNADGTLDQSFASGGTIVTDIDSGFDQPLWITETPEGDLVAAGYSVNATNTGSVTWCELAREIFRLAEIDVTVRGITTAEFGAAALRPGYSVLDCRKLAETTGFQFPPCQEALARYLLD